MLILASDMLNEFGGVLKYMHTLLPFSSAGSGALHFSAKEET